jgi:hypothetical protein
MIREPLAPAGVEVVVSHPASAGGGMNKPVVAGVDRDMTDFPVLGEQHQVAYLERAR